MFWAVVIVVTLKYVAVVMRADNDGEGGIMALIALLLRDSPDARARAIASLVAFGIFGASLFFGDSMITPAISVLSAVEGLEVVNPSLGHLVVPIAAAILVGLFALQRHGHRRGRAAVRPGHGSCGSSCSRARAPRDRAAPRRAQGAVAHVGGALLRPATG